MFEYLIFFFFAALALIFAVVVVAHRNAVIGALSLVMTFFSLAVMYVLLDAAFMAVLQVIIYAGAIMVLFLFVIMLLNLQKIPEPRTRPVQQFFAWVGCAWFGFLLVYYLVKAAFVRTEAPVPFASDARDIGYAIFEAYLLPFEMVSILLLAAIVGALVLTQRLEALRELSSEGTSPGEGAQ
jgi:NADH-quinone oxidoreductase subunit J